MSNAVSERATLAPNVRSFLSDPVRYGTIATINPDGSPHQIVIWYLLRRDDAHGDHIVVNSRRGRRWPSNLFRDGRANFCVYEAEDAVTVNCTVAQTYEGEQAQADIAEMAWRYDTTEDAVHEIERFATEERVTFILQPVKTLVHGSPG